MFTVSKMIQNRFGKSATIQTRPTLDGKRWKAELIFDVEEFGVEGLVRTDAYANEELAVEALNTKLKHIMGER